MSVFSNHNSYYKLTQEELKLLHTFKDEDALIKELDIHWVLNTPKITLKMALNHLLQNK